MAKDHFRLAWFLSQGQADIAASVRVIERTPTASNLQLGNNRDQPYRTKDARALDQGSVNRCWLA